MPVPTLDSRPVGRARTRPLLAGLAAAFVLLLALVAGDWGPLDSADETVATALHDSAVSSPGWTETARVLTDWVWDPWTMRALLLAAAAWLLWRGERFLAGWILATGAVGWVLQQGLKAAVGRERPRWPDPVDSAQYAAFPSGHAMSAVVTCGLLLWLLHQYGPPRRLWTAACSLAAVSVLGVGLTRLYLGVHWLSDVVGGWLLGAVVVGGSLVAYERLGLGSRS
ncbi:phosphatase PAP2 family protein [Streptomyces sp. NPDC051940]|uniref:phosphatase PAP2 family protein n=1 Tax=Streptomyces sp. NPDC051940 TaxID=3155675 RepID=UPI0034226F51